VGFEPTIEARERPKNYALDRAVSETGTISPLQTTITAYVVSLNSIL
jgi:hypothetical protein